METIQILIFLQLFPELAHKPESLEILAWYINYTQILQSFKIL